MRRVKDTTLKVVGSDRQNDNPSRSLTMDSNLKALLAKAWKDEDLDLEPVGITSTKC
jgi:hypothetical protein